MKILLLHAEDSPLAGPWIGQHWDATFDLARSGWPACERWSRALGCPVKPIDALRTGFAEAGRVRELLHMGLGQLVDREGLDWWELAAILSHHRLESLVLLRKLADSLPSDAEVWITRSGFEGDALRLALGQRLHILAAPDAQRRSGLGHSLGRLWRLPAAQVLQILGDKYDAGYRLRGRFQRRPQSKQKPVVLVPSSYVNMSLTAVAYARLVPDTDFLIVSTRSSGRLKETPDNVSQARLAAYAGKAGENEYGEILKRWKVLRQELQTVPELAALSKLGLMAEFPRRFADGLAIRDAWLNMLAVEPVRAVLCCDDSNPATHIPMLLAKRRGVPAISCHHGALDGRYLMKTCHSDVMLAKGSMELDYLVHTCKVDPSVVEIGAPSAPGCEGVPVGREDRIVFFSEPYEMTGGRSEEIYRDVIPGLSALAKRMGKKLAVKLHPSENLRDRESMVATVLTHEQRSGIEWLAGGMPPDLLRQTWFGVTVQSSVAVECVVHGVPCFLCEWLDLWPYGYIGQFRKFDVAMGLRTPADIEKIPDMLSAYRPNKQTAQSCWETIRPERLEQLLGGRRVEMDVPFAVQRAQ